MEDEGREPLKLTVPYNPPGHSLQTYKPTSLYSFDLNRHTKKSVKNITRGSFWRKSILVRIYRDGEDCWVSEIEKRNLNSEILCEDHGVSSKAAIDMHRHFVLKAKL
jgi:hypothetical protein